MANQDYLLQCKDIVKTFSGVTVLDKAQLNIRRGEIHALMGENGAGKSTIIKIITGVYQMDGGEIWFDGAPVKIKNRADAQKLGISAVFQELSLIPNRLRISLPSIMFPATLNVGIKLTSWNTALMPSFCASARFLIFTGAPSNHISPPSS